MFRAAVLGGLVGLASVPASAEVTCFTHVEIVVLPGTQWGTAGPAVGDFDGDGDLDVAVSRRETATLYWYETRPGGPGWEWVRHTASTPADPALKKGVEDSLGAAVLDVDGDLDVFAGEQEDPDTYMVANGLVPMKPEGLQERGVVWENVGTAAEPRFVPRVFHEGRPGWHDTVLVDFDGDGDLDLLSKVWNTGGRPYHLDLWRNDNPSCGTGGAAR